LILEQLPYERVGNLLAAQDEGKRLPSLVIRERWAQANSIHFDLEGSITGTDEGTVAAILGPAV
jgi:hypothetical protein